jgi:hypothetical protein
LPGLAAVASAERGGGIGSGPGNPGGQTASTQDTIFHYVPNGECFDAYVAGTTLRHAPPAPPTASGTISVPANVAANQAFAQLYWVILSDTEPPNTERLNGTLLARIPIGPVTASPCWAELHAYAYRANVLGLVTPGVNTLTGFPDSGAFGVSPESEGASLVVVHTTNGVDKEIIITAGNDLLDNFNGVTTATLPLPVVTAAGLGAELHFIGADGQVAPDEVFWNGVALDGGDAWQGLDPGAGVGFWDTLEFGVTVGPPNEASSTAPLTGWDCINWVGTVLKVKSGGCVSVPVDPKKWGDVKELYRP